MLYKTTNFNNNNKQNNWNAQTAIEDTRIRNSSKPVSYGFRRESLKNLHKKNNKLNENNNKTNKNQTKKIITTTMKTKMTKNIQKKERERSSSDIESDRVIGDTDGITCTMTVHRRLLRQHQTMEHNKCFKPRSKITWSTLLFIMISNLSFVSGGNAYWNHGSDVYLILRPLNVPLDHERFCLSEAECTIMKPSAGIKHSHLSCIAPLKETRFRKECQKGISMSGSELDEIARKIDIAHEATIPDKDCLIVSVSNVIRKIINKYDNMSKKAYAARYKVRPKIVIEDTAEVFVKLLGLGITEYSDTVKFPNHVTTYNDKLWLPDTGYYSIRGNWVVTVEDDSTFSTTTRYDKRTNEGLLSMLLAGTSHFPASVISPGRTIDLNWLILIGLAAVASTMFWVTESWEKYLKAQEEIKSAVTELVKSITSVDGVAYYAIVPTVNGRILTTEDNRTLGHYFGTRLANVANNELIVDMHDPGIDEDPKRSKTNVLIPEMQFLESVWTTQQHIQSLNSFMKENIVPQLKKELSYTTGIIEGMKSSVLRSSHAILRGIDLYHSYDKKTMFKDCTLPMRLFANRINDPINIGAVNGWFSQYEEGARVFSLAMDRQHMTAEVIGGLLLIFSAAEGCYIPLMDYVILNIEPGKYTQADIYRKTDKCSVKTCLLAAVEYLFCYLDADSGVEDLVEYYDLYASSTTIPESGEVECSHTGTISAHNKQLVNVKRLQLLKDNYSWAALNSVLIDRNKLIKTEDYLLASRNNAEDRLARELLLSTANGKFRELSRAQRILDTEYDVEALGHISEDMTVSSCLAIGKDKFAYHLTMKISDAGARNCNLLYSAITGQGEAISGLGDYTVTNWAGDGDMRVYNSNLAKVRSNRNLKLLSHLPQIGLAHGNSDMKNNTIVSKTITTVLTHSDSALVSNYLEPDRTYIFHREKEVGSERSLRWLINKCKKHCQLGHVSVRISRNYSDELNNMLQTLGYKTEVPKSRDEVLAAPGLSYDLYGRTHGLDRKQTLSDRNIKYERREFGAMPKGIDCAQHKSNTDATENDKREIPEFHQSGLTENDERVNTLAGKEEKILEDSASIKTGQEILSTPPSGSNPTGHHNVSGKMTAVDKEPLSNLNSVEDTLISSIMVTEGKEIEEALMQDFTR